MSEDLLQEATIEAQQTTQQPAQTSSDRLRADIFGGDIPVVPVTTETPAQQQPVVTKTEENDEIVDASDYLKKWNFESEEQADAEIKRLRELESKAQTPAEIKFANDESKRVHELIREGKIKEVVDYYNKQNRISDITSKETNKDNAPDIIKLGMQLKYPNLTQQEIDFKFNKDFGIPKEPVQKVDEADEDFAERKQHWSAEVEAINMNRIIEAKQLLPEIEKSKSQISLPEIEQKTPQLPQLSQEDLAAMKSDQEAFVKSAEKNINDFKGFNVQFKDKDVDYAVSYAPNGEQKTLITGLIKRFAETNFDTNSLFAERWLNEDKTLDVDLMIKDLSRIYDGDNMDKKLVTDSANKRLEAYLKEKKQVNVTASPSGTFKPEPQKDASEKLREQIFG